MGSTVEEVQYVQPRAFPIYTAIPCLAAGFRFTYRASLEVLQLPALHLTPYLQRQLLAPRPGNSRKGR